MGITLGRHQTAPERGCYGRSGGLIGGMRLKSYVSMLLTVMSNIQSTVSLRDWRMCSPIYAHENLQPPTRVRTRGRSLVTPEPQNP